MVRVTIDNSDRSLQRFIKPTFSTMFLIFILLLLILSFPLSLCESLVKVTSALSVPIIPRSAVRLFFFHFLTKYTEEGSKGDDSVGLAVISTCLLFVVLQKLLKLKTSVDNKFPKQALVLLVYRISLLKTLWEKEKLLVTSNFFFSHSVFLAFGELFAIFIKFEIVVCKLFQFGKV